MVQVLSAVAPGTEYTSLWLSRPNGGDLWVELQPGNVVDGPVEERVDGRGRRWLETTHKLQRRKPLTLFLVRSCHKQPDELCA